MTHLTSSSLQQKFQTLSLYRFYPLFKYISNKVSKLIVNDSFVDNVRSITIRGCPFIRQYSKSEVVRLSDSPLLLIAVESWLVEEFSCLTRSYLFLSRRITTYLLCFCFRVFWYGVIILLTVSLLMSSHHFIPSSLPRSSRPRYTQYLKDYLTRVDICLDT